MTKYKRVYVGRGIKPIDECPKCKEPGYLSVQWCARENTMTWCGPYFEVKHCNKDDQNSTHYIGIGLRPNFPELEKTPPSVEWMTDFRLKRGYASLPEYIEEERRKMQKLRANIRDNLMDLSETDLLKVISVLKDGGKQE